MVIIIALIVFLIAIVLIVANFGKILRWFKQLIQWIDTTRSNNYYIKYHSDEQNRFIYSATSPFFLSIIRESKTYLIWLNQKIKNTIVAEETKKEEVKKKKEKWNRFISNCCTCNWGVIGAGYYFKVVKAKEDRNVGRLLEKMMKIILASQKTSSTMKKAKWRVFRWRRWTIIRILNLSTIGILIRIWYNIRDKGEL